LKKLWLSSNQLTALPESIVALTNLTQLQLRGNNPLLIPSAQSAAVQAWLQAHEDSPAFEEK
jgi:Leucine-rich repeat (LRR) protein